MHNYNHQPDTFSTFADQWWDPKGVFSVLHDINPVRLRYIDQRALLSKKKVLDVGCGGGILAESMVAMGAMVTGIDISAESIDAAREHAHQAAVDISYLHTDITTFLAKKPALFDIVTCMELLEHVPDPQSLINACAQLVRPGGHVFFSTINRNIQSYLIAIVAAESILGMIPAGTHHYRQFIRPSELVSWCKESALQPSDITGMRYIPYIKRCYIGGAPTINYLMDTIRV